jgi:uncharacterized membrane protein
MDTWFVLTFAAAIGSGIVAGIFFAFSSFVMSGLARLAPAEGIRAMNAINVTAVTPMFMTALFGTAAMCVALLVRSIFTWNRADAAWTLSASVLYIACTIVVTIAFNVPRNNALAAVDPASEAGAALWSNYLVTWTAWNHVRTVGAALACAGFVIALLKASRPAGITG